MINDQAAQAQTERWMSFQGRWMVGTAVLETDREDALIEEAAIAMFARDKGGDGPGAARGGRCGGWRDQVSAHLPASLDGEGPAPVSERYWGPPLRILVQQLPRSTNTARYQVNFRPKLFAGRCHLPLSSGLFPTVFQFLRLSNADPDAMVLARGAAESGFHTPSGLARWLDSGPCKPLLRAASSFVAGMHDVLKYTSGMPSVPMHAMTWEPRFPCRCTSLETESPTLHLSSFMRISQGLVRFSKTT